LGGGQLWEEAKQEREEKKAFHGDGRRGQEKYSKWQEIRSLRRSSKREHPPRSGTDGFYGSIEKKHWHKFQMLLNVQYLPSI
jgi:hypothetical protein